MEPTIEVLKALEHVRKFHPDVIQVFYGIDCRWMYMDEHMESPVFHKRIDVGILEDAADSIEQFPAAFSWMEPDPEDSLVELKRKYSALKNEYEDLQAYANEAASYSPEIYKCRRCKGYCAKGYICSCGCDNSVSDEDE